jgi:hypothetical protein
MAEAERPGVDEDIGFVIELIAQRCWRRTTTLPPVYDNELNQELNHSETNQFDCNMPLLFLEVSQLIQKA